MMSEDRFLSLCHIEIALTLIRIGLDAKRIVRNGTGLGSYGRTLACDLARQDDLQLTLYAPDAGRNELRIQVPESERLHYAYPERRYALFGKAYWRSRGITRQLRRDSIQVYHGLSGELPFGISKTGIRSVVTIHDLIFLRHPEYYNKVDVAIYARKFRRALREADAVVAISECTRRDICELGDVDEQRVKVIYQSCASRFTGEPDTRLLWKVRDTYDLPDRYVLCVGTIEERKNQLLAVQALHHLPDDVSLLLVGRDTPYAERIRSYIDENRLNERVLILHGVPDDHLPALYRMAEAFVYPSRYEGFGIPIIEAVRMGLPVAACTGSCLEEAGGPDNLYVSPDDSAALAHALTHLLIGAKGREERIERSQRYVARFDNTGAAQHFVDLYRQLCG